MIVREDLLELTRRMTLGRHCFSRIAGAYLDEDGDVDGTFNRHFQRLSAREQKANLEIAKAVLFGETNVEVREQGFSPEAVRPGGIRQLLLAMRESELKNDALLDVFYEYVGQRRSASGPYAVYLFYGSYDVPLKAKDKERLWESEEVYSFLICAVCPVSGDYEPGEPVEGFLFPAFRDRSGDDGRIDVFQKGGHRK